MQVIQTIRDKGAAVVIAVIALSLIGFLLMDANSGTKGGGGFFKSLASNVGKVNGEAIEKSEFDRKYNAAYDMDKEQSAQSGRTTEPERIREQVWNQMVNEAIFYKEADKIGIDYTPAELNAFLYSNDPSNPMLQDKNMVDPATGKLDPAKVKLAIADLKKAKDKRLEMIQSRLTEPQRIASVSGKYFALLNASAYYPTWMQEKDKTEAKNFASISFVEVPFSVISDSTIRVSDDEINAYVDKHKKQFKQEEGRMISYVAYSQLPNSEDSANTKTIVAALKDSFVTAQNPAAFLARNASVIPFDTSYQAKAKIGSSATDTIIKQPIGTVYGPYIDGGNYVLAKVLGTKNYPDSVKARHILVPTADPQTGQPIMEDSVAKNKADSILTAIKGGADFAVLAKQFGTDGTKDKGGDLGFFGFSGPMVEEFNQQIFGKPVGTKEVIRTRFGYHVIELTAEKGSITAYKIAFMAKEISASPATISNANLNATKLSGQKTAKDFEAYIAKNGLQKFPSPLIKENDYSVGQLQNAKPLVKWAFDASVGDVSEPFNIGNQFIVATLDKVQGEGVQDAKQARQMVEGVIRNKKKTEAIALKLGNPATLEAAAAVYNQQVLTAGADSSITFTSFMIPNVGPEPKVIGASFNKDNQTKISAPIEGNSGVFVIKVNSIGTKPADTPEAEALRKTQQITTIRNQVGAGWFEGIKEQAKIEDNRSKYGY
ncbi:peptidylprolyl isomerase [Ferruginibacter sp. SUN106]|uniref:peptidylprolyl isomerase n=1 Tax=Ferruginibacter sp. SUN106 TaxID=2978348 RepID=UPI003D36BFBF